MVLLFTTQFYQAMFFKIAFRNLWKRKTFTIINITGLGMGLAACLLIYLYIIDELDYDNFYPEKDRIYRIVREHGEGGQKSASAIINYRLGELIREKMSQIGLLTRFSHRIGVKVRLDDRIFHEKRAHYADHEFLDMFGIRFLRGNGETALQSPDEVVLTRTTAIRIFKDEDIIDRSLILNDREYRVTGVVEELPENAHFHFDYLMSLESTQDIYGKQMFEHWGNLWLYTYARLNPGTQITEVEKGLADLVGENGPPELRDFGVRFYAQHIEDIHLRSQLSSELEQNGDLQLLRVLGAVAILILLIACFNFINLTTARSAWRSKEVGIKKVLGTKRSQLIRQFLGESLLTTFIAFILACIAAAAVLPFFNFFTGRHIQGEDMLSATPILLGIVISVGLLAGIIPALFLSSFEPVKVLKGQSQGNSRIANMLRQTLIIFQFCISIVLIIGALVIFQQLSYIRSVDLGANLERVIVLKLKTRETRQKIEAMTNTLEQLPAVRSVSAASDVPFEGLNSWRVKPKGYDMPEELISIVAIDRNYLASLEIALTDDSPREAVNIDDNRSILVNEAFARHFLLSDPVGSEIEIGHIEGPLRIVGMVKDYHFASLHENIRPLMLYVHPSWYSQLVIKTSSDDHQRVLTDMKSVWEEVNPGEEFDYYFPEERFADLYRSEEKTGQLVAAFSVFSMLIACMGLYGLAAYVAESRLKEISVRKILGASIRTLVQLQFNVFFRLMVVAAFLAVPLGLWLMNGWLSNFAYRVSIAPWIVIAAVITVLFFTVFSVGYRSLMAAMSNPTDNLRNE